MGDIARVAEAALAIEHIKAVHVDFPQNLFRDEPGYRRELNRAIEKYNPDVIIPIGHPLALSRMKEELSQRGIRAVVEKEPLIRLLDSKVAFSTLVAQLGITQPEIYASADDVPADCKVVFKRDVSFGGHGVHLPKSREALYNLIDHQSPGEPYLIEEFIDGEDYSVDAFRCGDTFIYGAYRSVESQGNGPSTVREALDAPLLAEIAKRIMEYLDYNGVCGFDFKVDSNGKAYILEANPRFTAGLATQIERGFNIPYLALSSGSIISGNLR